MAITIERKPYVEVTDEESGWSMTGGRTGADRSSTKEMTHRDGASCTLFLDPVDFRNPIETVFNITGMIYLNPGEKRGSVFLKEPSGGDFISPSELYAIAATLLIVRGPMQRTARWLP
jgi:hypothetical protein